MIGKEFGEWHDTLHRNPKESTKLQKVVSKFYQDHKIQG